MHDPMVVAHEIPSSRSPTPATATRADQSRRPPVPEMWDRPPPGEGCATDLTGLLWCLAIVILGGMAAVAAVAWAAGQ